MHRALVLLLLLLGVGGGAARYYYRQQNQLHKQLIQLTAVLATENRLAMLKAQNTIKRIEAAVAKNHIQPVDVAALRCAEASQNITNQLIAQIRDYEGLLRHGPATPPLIRQQTLEQRVTAYADTLRQLGLVHSDAPSLTVPAFAQSTPLVEALADLSRLESEVLVWQTFALQRIAKSVQARSWVTRLLAVATAESDIVAPGDIYRAQLRLLGYYSSAKLRMAMTCNGQPVSTGPDGTGLVRFRAPTCPGPATWTGTIRLNYNGRDSTFRVTVPYRVARR